MRREKTQISKIRNEKQRPWKSRESSETTLRINIPINWKIMKKWTLCRYV
jgi:hypothetical protein